MEALIIEILKTAGFPAVCLVGVGIYISRLTQQHKEERGEWRADNSKAIERRDTLTKETNEVLRQLSGVIERVTTKR